MTPLTYRFTLVYLILVFVLSRAVVAFCCRTCHKHPVHQRQSHSWALDSTPKITWSLLKASAVLLEFRQLEDDLLVIERMTEHSVEKLSWTELDVDFGVSVAEVTRGV